MSISLLTDRRLHRGSVRDTLAGEATIWCERVRPWDVAAGGRAPGYGRLGGHTRTVTARDASRSGDHDPCGVRRGREEPMGMS
jgi:hypothetical protein